MDAVQYDEWCKTVFCPASDTVDYYQSVRTPNKHSRATTRVIRTGVTQGYGFLALVDKMRVKGYCSS
eukprot:scaffold2830_cov131-Cylindrotheca_fusiformis.AAC.32